MSGPRPDTGFLAGRSCWTPGVRGGKYRLKFYHVLGLGAFFPLHYLELHFLAFVQGLETFTFDVAVVHEDIGTVSLGNEAIPLGIAEPLNLASYSHYVLQKFPGKKIRETTGKAFPFLEKPTGPTIAWVIKIFYKIINFCQILDSADPKDFLTSPAFRTSAKVFNRDCPVLLTNANH